MMKKLDLNAFILLTLGLSCFSFPCDIPFPEKLHGFGIKYFSQLVISKSSQLLFTVEKPIEPI